MDIWNTIVNWLHGIGVHLDKDTAQSVGQAADQVGDYRMAASAMPQTVLSAMDQMMVGEPLDHAGEEAARAAGWARR